VKDLGIGKHEHDLLISQTQEVRDQGATLSSPVLAAMWLKSQHKLGGEIKGVSVSVGRNKSP
jgi:hypothetical protein